MVSNKIQFRAKPELEAALSTLKKEWQYPSISAVVVQLLEEGLVYREERKREIQKLRDRLIALKVKPHELKLQS